MAVSILLFGNIVDNSISHKYLILLSNIIMAALYTVKAILIFFKTKFGQDSDFDIQITEVNIDLMLTAMEPTVNILIWMQLFNWVSKRQIAVIYGLLSLVSAGSNIVKTQLAHDA